MPSGTSDGAIRCSGYNSKNQNFTVFLSFTRPFATPWMTIKSNQIRRKREFGKEKRSSDGVGVSALAYHGQHAQKLIII